MRAGVVGWNENGIEGVLAHAAPDVVWHAQPEYMEGQEWRGRDAFAHAWHKQFDSVFVHVHTDFEAYEAGPNGHMATIRGHGRAHASGIDLKWHSYFVVTVDGDLITEV